jgi:hypothetical protein
MMDDEQAQPLAAIIVSVLRKALAGERDVTGWGRDDFLYGFGSTRGALIYSVLFAPNFVEVDGFIFIDDYSASSPERWDQLATNIREARAKSSDDLAVLVSSYNWLEVPYLFSDHRGADEEDTILARVIADAWRARLRGLYPDRTFEVRVLPPSETGSTIGVGFVELPHSGRQKL